MHGRPGQIHESHQVPRREEEDGLINDDDDQTINETDIRHAPAQSAQWEYVHEAAHAAYRYEY
jgi:hypothetical protein